MHPENPGSGVKSRQVLVYILDCHRDGSVFYCPLFYFYQSDLIAIHELPGHLGPSYTIPDY